MMAIVCSETKEGKFPVGTDIDVAVVITTVDCIRLNGGCPMVKPPQIQNFTT